MKKIYSLLAGCILCWSNYAHAQELSDSAPATGVEENFVNRLEFNGYTRGSIYGGSEHYDYTSAFGEFCLQGKLSAAKTFLFSDIRIRGGISLGEEFTSIQLKEAYAGYSGDRIDLFLGNQIVSWGRTDGFNPTNNITPNDYFFLSGEPDDQKLSNFMLRTKFRISGNYDIEIVGIPFYVPSVYRYDLFDMGSSANFTAIELPEKSIKNSSFATRLNAELPSVGFSLSWFRGYDPYHGFDLKQISWTDLLPAATYSPKPYLKNTLGVDFALPLGSWIVKGEMAYDYTYDYDTNIYIPAPGFSYVAGIEHSLAGFTLIFQYIGKYVTGFNPLHVPILADPLSTPAQVQYAEDLISYESALFNRKIFNQQEETNHAFSLAVNRSFAYDTWMMELTGYYNITSEEYMIRPKVTWKLTDALQVSAGGSYMDGPDKTIFDYASPIMSGAFVELKANF